MRFRQHLSDEMAHYSDDCWDAELLTSHGWKECIGIADRSCFDLSRHQEATNKSMMFFKKYDQPITIERLNAVPIKSIIGKTFTQNSKAIITYLNNLDNAATEKLRDDLQDGSVKVTIEENEYELLSTMVEFELKKEKKNGDWLVPSVVEPSFGIGRILYCLLEQSFYARPENTKRILLRLSPNLAPVKCSVLPLMKQDKFMADVLKISKLLRKAGISAKIDSTSATIGRRYVRMDEIGIPFGITVDHTTLEDQTVTLRERDSTMQVRIPIADLVENINAMINLDCTWADVCAKYPLQE
jgi:glycyl-tRNA synthetase